MNSGLTFAYGMTTQIGKIAIVPLCAKNAKSVWSARSSVNRARSVVGSCCSAGACTRQARVVLSEDLFTEKVVPEFEVEDLAAAVLHGEPGSTNSVFAPILAGQFCRSCETNSERSDTPFITITSASADTTLGAGPAAFRTHRQALFSLSFATRRFSWEFSCFASATSPG